MLEVSAEAFEWCVIGSICLLTLSAAGFMAIGVEYLMKRWRRKNVRDI